MHARRSVVDTLAPVVIVAIFPTMACKFNDLPRNKERKRKFIDSVESCAKHEDEA